MVGTADRSPARCICELTWRKCRAARLPLPFPLTRRTVREGCSCLNSVDQSPRMEKRVGQATLALSTALSATTSEPTARHISMAYIYKDARDRRHSFMSGPRGGRCRLPGCKQLWGHRGSYDQADHHGRSRGDAPQGQASCRRICKAGCRYRLPPLAPRPNQARHRGCGAFSSAASKRWESIGT